jgi:hypothetical protein
MITGTLLAPATYRGLISIQDSSVEYMLALSPKVAAHPGNFEFQAPRRRVHCNEKYSGAKA